MHVSKLFKGIPTPGSIGQRLSYVWLVESVEKGGEWEKTGQAARSICQRVRAKVNVETRQVNWIDNCRCVRASWPDKMSVAHPISQLEVR